MFSFDFLKYFNKSGNNTLTMTILKNPICSQPYIIWNADQCIPTPENREGELSQYSCLNVCFARILLIMLNEQQLYLFGGTQTSQTGGQPYNDTSPSSECSLPAHSLELAHHWMGKHLLLKLPITISGQSYNGFTIINYDSRGVPDYKIAYITTLGS